jgi:O-succinylhomoserine sulfhydrylase
MTTTPGGTNRPLHPETLAVRTQAARSPEREHSVPLYLTSSFVFDSAEHARALFADEVEGNIYSRYSNPNADEFVEKLCLLEGAEQGIATASGMAAVFATLGALLSAGDHVVAARALFGSTHQLLTRVLPRWGVTSTYVDATAPAEAWDAAIGPSTKLVFVETPSNPGLEVIDLAALGAVCRARGVPLAVDNCFCTPALQRPIDHGADIVVHSATKFIDGQGRALGGAVVGPARLMADVRYFTRHTGPSISPFNAWVLSKSLETLALRMEKHSANALRVAAQLERHAAVERVRYPFLAGHPQHALARRQMRDGGGVLTLVVRGGIEAARRFVDGLELVSHSPNLGDTRSIATHPASTTHSKLTEEERRAVGIAPGLVRVSVGLEHPDDVFADLAQALDRSQVEAPRRLTSVG